MAIIKIYKGQPRPEGITAKRKAEASGQTSFSLGLGPPAQRAKAPIGYEPAKKGKKRVPLESEYLDDKGWPPWTALDMPTGEPPRANLRSDFGRFS